MTETPKVGLKLKIFIKRCYKVKKTGFIGLKVIIINQGSPFDSKPASYSAKVL